MDTITKRQARRLIKALESGEYKKTKNSLCNKRGDAFCCLGVYADIQGAKWETNLYGNLYPENNNENTVLLEYVWAGGLSQDTQIRLAEINDKSRNFNRVIKYLKEEILPKAL